LITNSIPKTTDDISVDVDMDTNTTNGGVAVESEAAVVEGLERTVFVNAANWPAGKNAWRDGVKIKFGGLGFQPVIVDLKD